MTMAEKILARASDKASVRSGDVVEPIPEFVILHDGCVEGAYRQLSDVGYARIEHPERVLIFTDHQVVHTSPKAIAQAAANRRIAREWGVERFFASGRGGHGHLYPIESGMIKPGMFLFAYDGHCTNFGAVGAFAQRAGSDISVVLGTGTLWTVVPPTVKLELIGSLPHGVHPRDVGFWLSGEFKSGRLGIDYDYRVIEFGGPGADTLSVAAKVAMCNTLTEIGVANTLFSQPGVSEASGDPDAVYEAQVSLDLSQVVPQVALPGAPHQAVPVGEVSGIEIDHAYVGGCGSGMYDDIVAVARLLRGRQIAERVRFFVVPGTVQLSKRLADEGISQALMEAGVVLLPPGCGPCAGGAGGPLTDGEVSISTAATNGAGRMGSKSASCYLGSPETVALAALTGYICDPRSAADVRGRP